MFAERLREAQAAARRAHHEQVIAACDQALQEAASGSSEPDEISEIRFLRADSLRHLGRWSDADAEFQAVSRYDGSPAVRARACRAYRLLAEIARRSRHYDEAFDYAEQATRLALELGDGIGHRFSQVPLARILSDRGQGAEAEALLAEVLAAVEGDGTAEAADRALVTVAARTVQSLLHFRRQQISEALAVLTSVRDQVEHVTHAISRAAYHRQTAILHEVQQNYSGAIRHLNLALDLYDRVRFEPGRYDVYWSLSLSYTDMGDLRTARICLEQCATIAERLGLPLELGKSKSSFAELALREGDYEEAVDLFRQDLAISRDLSDEHALGHCHRKLADCYRIMGDQARAEEHARSSMNHFDAVGRFSEVNQVRILLGRILTESGRLDEAREVFTEASEQAGERARRDERAGLLRAEAQLARAQGRLEEAIDGYTASLELHDERHPSRDLAATHYETGAVCLQNGDVATAKRHLHEAVDVAGLLGSRDIWQQAVDELWKIDPTEAQGLMLRPYLPGRAVDELRGGEAPARVETATVMFVDMRGATALSGTLSPLELSEVVSAFLGPVVRIILRWGGSVDKFIGDCVMAVFGQQGADDGADAATHAGLEITEYMEATQQIRQKTGASILQATIGINTGEVVAGCFGPLLRRDYTVLGYHVNLAQRLQSVASAVDYQLGTRMVIAESTRRGLKEEVPLERIDLSGLKMKGIDTGVVEAWLVRAHEAITAQG